MRECDRCGKKIQYGTLCHDCDIYLTSFCAGSREGRKSAIKEERERIVGELEKEKNISGRDLNYLDYIDGINKAIEIVRGEE